LIQLERLAGLAPGELIVASVYVFDPGVFATDRTARDAGRVLTNDAALDWRITIDELDLLRAPKALANG
jgi:hypothetical protein